MSKFDRGRALPLRKSSVDRQGVRERERKGRREKLRERHTEQEGERERVLGRKGMSDTSTAKGCMQGLPKACMCKQE